MNVKIKFFNRILAFIYDSIIQLFIVLGMYILIYFVFKDAIKADLKTPLMLLMVYVTFIVYLAVIPLKLNGTIGKAMTDLDVVATHGRLTFGRWLFRELVFKNAYFYIGITVFVYNKNIDRNYLLIYFGIGLLVELLFVIFKRLTIHDYFLKTKVVTKEGSE